MGRSRNTTRARLAESLKLAIDAMKINIRKLERTGAHGLLIDARKRQLANLEEELSRIGRKGWGRDRSR
jgi:hypothetical protein